MMVMRAVEYWQAIKVALLSFGVLLSVLLSLLVFIRQKIWDRGIKQGGKRLDEPASHLV